MNGQEWNLKTPEGSGRLGTVEKCCCKMWYPTTVRAKGLRQDAMVQLTTLYLEKKETSHLNSNQLFSELT